MRYAPTMIFPVPGVEANTVASRSSVFGMARRKMRPCSSASIDCATVSRLSPGGMLGGGPRGSRDDESSRTTPGYLVTAGDENSMVDDLPMVSPPVLGAENPDQYLFRDL